MKYGIDLLFDKEKDRKNFLKVLVDVLKYSLIPTGKPNDPRYVTDEIGFETIHFDAPELNKTELENKISSQIDRESRVVIRELYRVDLT